MALNFNDALNTSVSDIEKPPLMPFGTYRWVVEKIPIIETSRDGKWDYLDFPLKCIAPMDDVDADSVKEFTEKSGAINNVRQRHRFIFDRNDDGAFNRTLYNVKRFLTNLGLDAENIPLKQALNQAVNKQLLATIKWTQDKENPDLQYANIGKTAPVE